MSFICKKKEKNCHDYFCPFALSIYLSAPSFSIIITILMNNKGIGFLVSVLVHQHDSAFQNSDILCLSSQLREPVPYYLLLRSHVSLDKSLI